MSLITSNWLREVLTNYINNNWRNSKKLLALLNNGLNMLLDEWICCWCEVTVTTACSKCSSACNISSPSLESKQSSSESWDKLYNTAYYCEIALHIKTKVKRVDQLSRSLQHSMRALLWDKCTNRRTYVQDRGHLCSSNTTTLNTSPNSLINHGRPCIPSCHFTNMEQSARITQHSFTLHLHWAVYMGSWRHS